MKKTVEAMAIAKAVVRNVMDKETSAAGDRGDSR